MVRRKSGYRASVAQAGADQRSRRPKVRLLAQHQRLADHVQQQLLAKHSPEQISHRLMVDFPDDLEMRVSHETIYQAWYVQGLGGLRALIGTRVCSASGTPHEERCRSGVARLTECPVRPAR